MWQKIRNAIRRLHRDERGMEAMQTVMIIAIAALVIVVVVKFGNKIVAWASGKEQEMENEKLNGP